MEKKKILPVVIAVVLMALIIVGAVGVKLYEKYSYSKETMDLSRYYGIEKEGQVPIILADVVAEEKAANIDGNDYLPLSFVQEQLNSRFYYDVNEKLLLYTTALDLYEIPLDSTAYTVSGEAAEHTCPIFVLQDEVPYVSLSFMENFSNFICNVYEAPHRLQIYTENVTHQTAVIQKATAVRYQGGIKSDILEQQDAGSQVTVLEEMENWSKVETADAVIGYVENKRLEAAEDQAVEVPISYVIPEYTSIHKDYKINMAWHQVTNAAANDGVEGLLANTKAVNTISPTWFFLNDNAGNFTSIASQTYVDAMHARGIEVWALIDNFTNDVDIAQILGTTTNRKNLISQLVGTVTAMGIDGINIDFEQVPESAGNDYVQFLRELSISCRKNQIVLSVDNYVPTGYTAHYDRKEQGTVVDYVVIMGYDEHYAGSAEAGSVASIGYVQQGIENTVSAVPQEKVINAVPFYTRLWKWGESLTSEALSMSAAANYLAQYGAAASWDETTCQDYATFEADGVTYQIWLENAKSLEAKLQVMSAYQLGGIAEWKLGLETPDVWTLIENYVKNEAAMDPVISDETAAVQNAENTGDTGEQTDTVDEQAPLEEIVTE